MASQVSTYKETQAPPYRPGADARPVRTGRQRLRSALIGVGAIGLLSTASLYGEYWWRTGRFMVDTDDAYVQAHSVIISPQVSGYIVTVPVDDNARVRAGEVLARIDPRDYETALAAARANVAGAQASTENLQQQIEEQILQVATARATVVSDQAAVTFAQQQNARYAELARTGAGTVQSSQQWQAQIQEKQADLARDTIGVGVAQKQVGVLRTALSRAQATLAQQQAALHQAELNLGYTTLTAPVDGTIADRTVRVGQYVQSGTQLMAVVPLQAAYVTANYEETQLTHVHPGQPVTIHVDTFPDATVHGVVDSVAPASGQEFALLPPDNATGNFVKIVQRIPVKITIDPHDPLLGRLRPGMSVEPVIDTKPGV
jgi:membrane fusion protein, multidrug efflux system